MKRFLCLLLVALMIAPGAIAEGIDLSGMTFEELVELKDKINLAIWQCQEWQEVTVPQGVWKVGEDIPAGTWTVRCTNPNFDSAYVNWGEKLSENGETIAYSSRSSVLNIVYNPNHRFYKEGEMTEYTFTVQDGDYIVIQMAPVIFSPYTGKPSLGFK